MEDTNIPDQLTYHDPVQRNPKEEKDPCPVGCIHPLYGPFRSLCPALSLHLPAHIATPIQTYRACHSVLFHHPLADAEHISDAENQRMVSS